MRCLKDDQLDAYLGDELTPLQSEAFQAHLASCHLCQQQLKQFVDELETSEDMEIEDWQTEAVTQGVVEKLAPYPVTVLKPIQQRSSAPTNWKKRSVDIVKKTTLAVAGLALAVSFGMMVSPTFATYVQGLYAANSPIKGPYFGTPGIDKLFDEKQTDQGVKEAVEKGYVKPLDLKVTDQGLTFEVKAVLADPLQIKILGSVTDKNGKKIDNFWKDQFSVISSENVNDFREIVIKDKQGNVITPYDTEMKHDGNPLPESYMWMPLPNGDNFVLDRGLNRFFKDRSEMPDEMIVELHVKRIGDTKGTWNLEIPVDLKSAKAATKTVTVNKQYKSPQGVAIDFKQVTFAPSGTELVLDTNYETTYRASDKKGLRYELVDDQGNVLGEWDDSRQYRDNEEQKNVVYSLSRGVNNDNGARWFQTFHSIDSTTNFTLKLKSIFALEPAAFSAKLSLAELEQKPITAEEQGNRFTFKKVTKETDEDGTNYFINVEGTLAKDIAGITPDWKATDESGETYSVSFYPSITVDESGGRKLSGQLKIWDVKKQPKTFTITYDKKLKEYRDVNWEVPIKADK